MNLLTLGDSKTAATPGYQATLLTLLYNSHIVANELPPRVGVGGIDTAGMSARVDADIAGMTDVPDEILINLGANDCNTNPGKVVFKASMLYIVNAYHTAFPLANIHIAKIWRQGITQQVIDAIAYMNEAIDELYAANAWLKPGINEALFLEGGDNGATYTSDGVHPNAAGYALEAASWKAAMGY